MPSSPRIIDRWAYSGTSAGQGIPVTYVLNYATENLDASTAGVVSLQFTISNI